MQSNTLIVLLRSFSPKEINAFRDFLISPYFNKKNSVIKLFEILRKQYPDFSGEEVSKNNIYSQLFPGKTYNDSNFRVLVHNLNELAKKFLAYINFEKDKTEFDYRQILELMNKKQYGNLDKLLSKLSVSLEKRDMNSEEFAFQKFRLEDEKLYYLSISHSGLFEKFLDKADFEKVFQYFLNFYFIKSLRLYINLLNIQIIYKKEFNTEAFEKMLSMIDEKMIAGNPVIEIFYCIVKLFDKYDNKKYYFRTKEMINKFSETLHFDDISEIYINLTNYCNRKISEGKNEFQMEKFELYKEEIRLKLYELKGWMSPVYYKNLVILALNLKENDWVRDFILGYKHELPEETRENVFSYCMALYELEMKNFEEALVLLSRIKFDELYLKYDSKVLQLMIYYEMDAQESLISSMEAFRQFLSNNKLLPDNKKELYSNFYNTFNKFLNCKKKNDDAGIEILRINLNGPLPLSNKPWVVSKINEYFSK